MWKPSDQYVQAVFLIKLFMLRCSSFVIWIYKSKCKFLVHAGYWHKKLAWKVGSTIMGLIATKPVFGVSDKVRFKPACSATETSYKIEVSLVASLDILLSNKRITKALIRLRGCAGWSAPVLFAKPRRQVFSRQGPYIWTIDKDRRLEQPIRKRSQFWGRFLRAVHKRKIDNQLRVLSVGSKEIDWCGISLIWS